MREKISSYISYLHIKSKNDSPSWLNDFQLVSSSKVTFSMAFEARVNIMESHFKKGFQEKQKGK